MWVGSSGVRLSRGRLGHQVVLHLACGRYQHLEQLLGEIGREIDFAAPGQVARAHLGDTPGLHHRDPVCELEEGNLAAHLEALTKQMRDLIVQLVESPAEGIEAAHESSRLMRVPSWSKSWVR